METLMKKKKRSQVAQDGAANLCTGRVVSVQVAANAGGATCTLAKKGQKFTFKLPNSDPSQLSGMISLASSAFVSGEKLHVTSASGNSEEGIVVSMWIGAIDPPENPVAMD
jgi:hypothetical protein